MRVEADNVLDLLFDAVRLGGGEVDLVEDRHDLVIVVERLVNIGKRLRLDALARIDNKERPLARGKAPAHLIAKIHVAGRVHQVQLIKLAILRAVIEADRLSLDRYPALFLDLHTVENLSLTRHFAVGHAAAKLDEPVCERRFAVIDVRDDREISDVREWRHAF